MPWQTTSAGSAPRFDLVAAPRRRAPPAAANDSPPGNAKAGSPATNLSNSSGASACTSAKLRSVQSPASVSISRASSFGSRPIRARDDLRRFARAQQRAAPQRREPVLGGALGQLARPARGRCRRAAPAAGPGSDPRGCRPSGRGGRGRRCMRRHPRRDSAPACRWPAVLGSRVLGRSGGLQLGWAQVQELVEQRRDRGAEQRPGVPDPAVGPVVADELRAERARGVHRGAGERAAEEHVDRDRQADRQAGDRR